MDPRSDEIDDVMRDLEGPGRGHYFLIYRRIFEGGGKGHGGRIYGRSPVLGRIDLTPETMCDVRSAALSLAERRRWPAGTYLLELRKTGQRGAIRVFELPMEP